MDIHDTAAPAENDDVGRELVASALLVLSTGLLIASALGAVWLLG